MNLSLRVRLLLFIIGLVVGLGLIGGVAASTWRLIGGWQDAYRGLQLETEPLGLEFKRRLMEVEVLFQQYWEKRTESNRDAMFATEAELRRWLDDRIRSRPATEVLAVLVDCKEAMLRYLAVAAGFLMSPPSDPEVSHQQTVAYFEDQVETLREFDVRLSEERYYVARDLIQRTGLILDRFREVVIGLLLLLLVLGFALARTTYRDWIAPLRANLVQSQAILERQEKLNALGLLAAGIAHEVRNPLTSIKARLFCQRKGLEAQSQEFEDNMMIGAEISRLERIVKDFLRFARPSEPVFVVTKSSEALRAAADLTERTLRDARITLVLRIVEDSEIRIDPDQMKQVLVNLIRNAAESMEGGGRLTLSARRRADRRVRRGGACAVLEVTDTGSGIPGEVQPRLFDPFFTTRPEGSGLGLSIVARIVQDHGGDLEYQTRSGIGTTFRILLPVAPVGVEQAESTGGRPEVVGESARVSVT